MPKKTLEKGDLILTSPNTHAGLRNLGSYNKYSLNSNYGKIYILREPVIFLEQVFDKLIIYSLEYSSYFWIYKSELKRNLSKPP